MWVLSALRACGAFVRWEAVPSCSLRLWGALPLKPALWHPLTSDNRLNQRNQIDHETFFLRSPFQNKSLFCWPRPLGRPAARATPGILITQ